MTVEIVTTIADLNPAAPTGAERKSDGDDHIRNIKKAVKNSFPGFVGAVIVAGIDGGSANAYTLTPATPLTAYSAKTQIIFSPVADGTGPATINVSGLGAKDIVSTSGAALAAGDLVSGRLYAAIFDGTRFRLMAVTQKYIDQLIISGIIPGVNVAANAGKFFTTDGASGQWASVDGRGAPALNKGNSGTTDQIVSYADGEGQSITATGNHALSATGFPAGRLSGVLLRMVNYGTFTLTTTGINWIKADGSTTTSFANSGIALPASGAGFVALFSYGDGVIYGKAA